MKKIFSGVKSLWSFHNSGQFRWRVTLIFIGLFAFSMYVESLRTSPSFSILGGALTTNLPTIVVIFYLIVGVCLGFFQLRQRVHPSFRELIVSNKEAHLSELGADDDGFADVEIEIED